MRICFVSKGNVDSLRENIEEFDLLLFGFNGLSEVSYEKELKGDTRFFERVATLSKERRCVLVSGCVTDTRGHKRKSAVVAENGRILGVSDTLYAIDGDCGCGAELRVYETTIGKMGVAVAEDIFFPESLRAMVTCGCDFIVCPYEQVKGELPSVLLRADAFRLGVPILLCGEGGAVLADPSGRLEFSSPDSPICFSYRVKKEYHLVEYRRRGCF